MAADVVGYSRLMGEDEQRTLSALREIRTSIFDPAVHEESGKIIKRMGDGWLVEFPSIAAAIACAINIQSQLTDHEVVQLRIGIHTGDVTFDDEDIYGDGVNIAARLEALAKPGQILLSDTAHHSLDGKGASQFGDGGTHHLKNIAREVQTWVWPRSSSVPQQAEPLKLPDKPSVAVLPFINNSGNADQDYFSDGITEDIITELTKISGIFVIARHSVFSYKRSNVSLEQIGRDLGVRHILEGTVRSSASRLRISVQLLDAKNNTQLWAERYDRVLDDVFEVQDDVAKAVANALAVTLQPEERRRIDHIPTPNTEAYHIYLRSRAAPWPPTRENILSGRSAYERISQLAPTFSGGPVGLSLSYSLYVLFGFSQAQSEDIGRALDLALGGVRLDDQFALGHCALAMAYSLSRRYVEALASTKQAIELQPGDADVHLYAALSQLLAGDVNDAYDSIHAALRLDPQYIDGPYLNVLGYVCICGGLYDEALAALQKNIDRGGPLGPPALVFRIIAYVNKNNIEAAEKTVRQLTDFVPNFSISKFALFTFLEDREVAKTLTASLRTAGLPE